MRKLLEKTLTIGLVEGVHELIPETPGLSDEDQKILQQALDSGKISNKFPGAYNMIEELLKNKDLPAGFWKDGGGRGAIAGAYLQYVLLPKARSVQTDIK